MSDLAIVEHLSAARRLLAAGRIPRAVRAQALADAEWLADALRASLDRDDVPRASPCVPCPPDLSAQMQRELSRRGR